MKKKIILSVLFILLSASLIVWLTLRRANHNLEALAQMPLTRVDLTTIKDGCYSGSFRTFPVAATVEVTVEEHCITNIVLVKHSHGHDAPAVAVLDRVLEKQSLQVDLVTGATYSSKAMLKAVEDAFKKSDTK